MNKLKCLVLTCLLCLSGVFACNNVSAVSYELVDMKQVGFGNIDIPTNISNDEFKTKAIYFAVKDEAKRMKKIKINYTGNGSADDCYVCGYIEGYELKASWCEPFAGATNKVVWSSSQEWKDDKGKEQTMTTTRYESEAYGVPAGYTFNAYVDATLNLVSSKTGEVLVSYTASERNDKEIDAFRKIVEDFYKRVNKEIKESKKLFKN